MNPRHPLADGSPGPYQPVELLPLAYENPRHRPALGQGDHAALTAFLLGVMVCIPYLGLFAVVLAIAILIDWKKCSGGERVLTLLGLSFGITNLCFWTFVVVKR